MKQPRLLEVGGVQLADVRRFEFDGFSQGTLLWGLTTKPLVGMDFESFCFFLNDTLFMRKQTASNFSFIYRTC